MARYAVIEDDKVVNVVEAGADMAEERGWIRSDLAGVGDLFDGIEFLPAPVTVPVKMVPQKVSRRQGRQALLLRGLLDHIPQIIEAIEDPIERGLAMIEWVDAQEFERYRPLVLKMGAALDLDLDEWFIFAEGL